MEGGEDLTTTIEIPESVIRFPGIQNINNQLIFCNKKGKCGCRAFIDDGATVRRIRMGYLQSVQEDLFSNGADWKHAPGAKNPAGSTYVKQFITPIATQEKTSNPKTTRQPQQYTYDIPIVVVNNGSNGSTTTTTSSSFRRICPGTFQQIFGLTKRSLTKIRNDMMGKSRTTIEKKRGLINGHDVDKILSQLAQSEKYKSSVSILCGDDMKVRGVSYSHNEYNAWLELLTILNDGEFLQVAKRTGDYPTYTKKLKTEQPPPAVSFPTVYQYLRRANNKTFPVPTPLPTPPPQQNQKATLLVTGDGIYQRGLNFKRIPDVYGRCQQCKALREYVPNFYECTFNIFTPTHFDDTKNNLKWIHGSLVNDDDDRHFDKDQLTGRGAVCFEWLLDKLKNSDGDGKDDDGSSNNNKGINNKGIGELIFVGVGFTRNGEALQRILFDVVEKFPNLNITVVDIDKKREIKQHSYIRDKSLFYWNNISNGNTTKQVKFVCNDAEVYLKELFMERTGFTSEQYNDLLQNKMTYPTTDDMNQMVAHWDDTIKGWILNELRPHSDEWVKFFWDQLRKDNGYADPLLFAKRVSRSSTASEGKEKR